jgi:hypothetical protein
MNDLGYSVLASSLHFSIHRVSGWGKLTLRLLLTYRTLASLSHIYVITATQKTLPPTQLPSADTNIEPDNDNLSLYGCLVFALASSWIFLMYDIQHCFICRPSDFTVSEDAWIEPRTVATTALAVRRSNHSARSHPHLVSSSFCDGKYSLFLIIESSPTQDFHKLSKLSSTQTARTNNLSLYTITGHASSAHGGGG